MSDLEHIRPTDLFNAATYTHVVTSRRPKTIYISGQVAIDAAGASVGVGDLAAQTDQVMKNLGVALAAAGASFSDVIKITTFVVDYKPEHRAVIGEVRGRYFASGNPPASTLVGVSALAGPDWLIEIEAVAVTD